jgi:hypothetical protein
MTLNQRVVHWFAFAHETDTLRAAQANEKFALNGGIGD